MDRKSRRKRGSQYNSNYFRNRNPTSKGGISSFKDQLFSLFNLLVIIKGSATYSKSVVFDIAKVLFF